ncbi:MAG TPA: aldolase/citrate lyase family protein [Microbacterium sp.]|nr:aldolase/citrate lyase family protein [Microbacterium sp.]
MATASLRARAEAGERLLGVLLRMPAEELVEMTAVAGFDFVLIDCEHGPDDVIALRQHVAAAALHGVPAIVRVGRGDHAAILRVLDQGAQGIVAPHLDSPAEAAATVDAAHYPPLGNRGFATYSRAGRFGETDAAAHREWFRANTLVIGMIESPGAVAGVDAILRTEGLDGLMIGPADLAASSGPSDPPIADAVSRVNRAVYAAAKLRMDIVPDPAAAQAAFESGAHLVVYNLAHSLMRHFRDLRGPVHGR